MSAAPELDPIAAELAAAWETFREAVNPPAHLAIREHFERVVRPLIVAARDADKLRAPAPYIHGDPRVDRWQVITAGVHAPTAAAPPGFEPLAAWTPIRVDLDYVAWQRPLRAFEVPPAPTEESALAALLVAWDSWPPGRGLYGDLIGDLTTVLEHAGMADRSALTETARAIVARAAERGQP